MDNINNKIVELIELATEQGDNATVVILHALKGSRHCNLQPMLAAKIQEYLKDVMLPKIKAEQANEKASKN